MTEPVPDEQTIQRYSDLARLHLEATNAHVASLIQATSEEVPQAVRSAVEAAQQNKYEPVMTAFGGLFFMTVGTTIKSNGKSYSLAGLGGGMGFGASASWGAAWLNYPIESIVGWRFRFEMNIAAHAVNINWWGMKGEVIGSFLGGGITLAAGIFGGQGSISQQ